MDHKLVCWDDYAIPVPVWAKWISWDESVNITVFSIKPDEFRNLGFWDVLISDGGRSCDIFAVGFDLPPPEPGPWYEQLYWIGD